MRFIFILLTSLLTAISLQSGAQASINSPYTRFGLGSLTQQGNPRIYGLGGVSSVIFDGGLVNFQNPASYSYLQQTVLQTSVQVNSNEVTDGSNTTSYRGGQVSEIGFGFKKEGGKWGFAMGLTPYSNTGYSISSPFSVNDSVSGDFLYSGSGGLNRFIVGTARTFSFKVDTTAENIQRIAVGVNFNWIFGQLNQTRQVLYDDNDFLNTLINSQLSVSDINFDLGVHYTAPLQLVRSDGKVVRGKYLLLGADYSLGNKLNSRLDQYAYTSINEPGNTFALDTTYNKFDIKGNVQIPSRLNVGLGFLMLGKRGSSLLFATEYANQKWSTFTTTFSDLPGQKLSDFAQFSLGIEYTPRDASKANSIFSKMQYRVGMRSTDTYYLISSSDVTQQAVSAGLSIPFTAIKSRNQGFSKLYLGVELGESTGENIQVKENFMNFQIGLSLIPFERWFERTRYD